MAGHKSNSPKNSPKRQTDRRQDSLARVKLQMCGMHMLDLLNRWSERADEYEKLSDEVADAELIQLVAAGMLSDIDDVLSKLKEDASIIGIEGFDGLGLPDPLTHVFVGLVQMGKDGNVGQALRPARNDSEVFPTYDKIPYQVVQIEAVVAIERLTDLFKYSEIKAARCVASALDKGGFITSKAKAGEQVKADTVKRWRKKAKDPKSLFALGAMKRLSEYQNHETQITEADILENVRKAAAENRIA